ncbi:glycosyltransferase [Paenibacillus thiaminolyticus]|uniref:glycosyltransferase n=1 Tax=Paenibacillus thiaminolyticus TaxID=49283 RepID=UPI00232E57CE|nr:glycosyltransferase [Paenibacillus thiaminolyticus]WCF07871.1 glycosyltransferase [Paenibacillus thiaminolyticus]
MLRKKKRILIFDRNDSGKYAGGDTIQIHAIVSYLKRLGCYTQVTSNPLYNLEPFDYIIIFNLTRPYEAYMYAKAALRYNKPYIVFPVYWDLDSLKMEEVISGRFLLKKLLPTKFIWVLRAFSFYRGNKCIIKKLLIKRAELFRVKKLISYVLNNSLFICPNSNAELMHLKNSFTDVDFNEKAKVVYNGINLKDIKKLKENRYNFLLPEKFICCVGGIGPRKNQLNLIRAANITKIPLVIIGSASKGNERYEAKVKQLADEHVIFINHISQSDVFNILSKASGHIQPSYIETPGLASLEAAALGCNIGVSDVGPVREYFGEEAYYCNPYSVESIVSCLTKLYNADTELQHKIKGYIQRFDWDNVLSVMGRLIDD